MRKLTVVMTVLLALIIASSFAFAEAGKSKIRFGLQYVSPTGDFKYSEFEAGPISDELYFPAPIDSFVTVTATDYSLANTTEADAAMAFFFGYEYMVTDMIGIDTNLSYSKHDIDSDTILNLTWTAEGTGNWNHPIHETGSITMMPIAVGVNFHVMKKEKVDLYLGPFLGYVMYGDAKLDKYSETATITSDPLVDPFPLTESFSGSLSEKVKIKNDFGFGAVVGIDVPFSNNWMFTAALKYFKTKASVDEEMPIPFSVENSSADIDINPWVIQIGVGYQF